MSSDAHPLPCEGQSSSSSHPQVRSGGEQNPNGGSGATRGKEQFRRSARRSAPAAPGAVGVAKIGIFGSTARGDDRPESDVDVLVEFAPGQTTFRNFMELAFYLEDLFGRRVDLVTDQGLSRYLRPHVEQEVIWCDA